MSNIEGPNNENREGEQDPTYMSMRIEMKSMPADRTAFIRELAALLKIDPEALKEPVFIQYRRVEEGDSSPSEEEVPFEIVDIRLVTPDQLRADSE